jgi:hypothetical protein
MIDAVNGGLMIGNGLVVATRGATDVAVRATGLTGTGTGTGNEKKTESEGIVTATTTDKAIAIKMETTRETVAVAGVKTTVTRQKNVPRRNVATKVRTRPPLSPLPVKVHAGVLREPIPAIVLVIDVPGILVIPETNSMTRPSMGGIVGDAATSVALALKMTPLNASRPRRH